MSSKNELYRKAIKKAADDERKLEAKLRAEKAAEISAGKKPVVQVPKKKNEMDRILPPKPFSIREPNQIDQEKIPPPDKVEKSKPVEKTISKAALRKELQDMVSSDVDPKRSDMSIVAVPTEETTALEVLQPSFEADVSDDVLEHYRHKIVVGLSSSTARSKMGVRKVNPKKTPVSQKQSEPKAGDSSGKKERVTKKRKLADDVPSRVEEVEKEAEDVLAINAEKARRFEVIPFRMDPKYNPHILSSELINLKPPIRRTTYKNRDLNWKQIEEERLAAAKEKKYVEEVEQERDAESSDEEREGEESEEREIEEIEILPTENDREIFVPKWGLRNRDSVLLSPASAIEFLDNSSTPGDVEVLKEMDGADLKTNMARAICEVIRYGWEGFQRSEELQVEKSAESASIDQIRRSLEDYLEEVKKRELKAVQKETDSGTSKSVVRSLEDKLADLRRKNSFLGNRVKEKNKIINVSAEINSDLRESKADLQAMYDFLKKRYKQTLSQLSRREKTIDSLRSKIEGLKISHGEGCSYVPQIEDDDNDDDGDEDLDENEDDELQIRDDQDGDDSDPE